MRKARRHFIRSRDEAARKLGVSSSLLSHWKREPWFPDGAHVEGKGWDVERIRQARDVWGRAGSQQTETLRAVKLATDAEKLKQHRVRTAHAQLTLDARKGELYPRDGFVLFITTFLKLADELEQKLPATVVSGLPKRLRQRADAVTRSEIEGMRRRWIADLSREATERGIDIDELKTA